jgi:large subunit ribosomal protein L10
MSGDNKKKLVKKVKELIAGSPVVGIVNMHALPAAQLQRMRLKLRGRVNIFMAKKSVISHALEEIGKEKKGVEKLAGFLNGMPALLLSSDNPFRLYSFLQKSKSKAAAKAGQKAPKDIVIFAGPTPFAPGPIISELGKFGLRTKVNAGKIEITQDAIVAKEGALISNELASLLLRLSIEPMEIGLDLTAVYENGGVFTKDILAIDESQYSADFASAYRESFNLSIEAGIFNCVTVEFLIQKAFKEAKVVAVDAGILAEGAKEEVLAKAEAEMASLMNEIKF